MDDQMVDMSTYILQMPTSVSFLTTLKRAFLNNAVTNEAREAVMALLHRCGNVRARFPNIAILETHKRELIMFALCGTACYIGHRMVVAKNAKIRAIGGNTDSSGNTNNTDAVVVADNSDTAVATINIDVSLAIPASGIETIVSADVNDNNNDVKVTTTEQTSAVTAGDGLLTVVASSSDGSGLPETIDNQLKLLELVVGGSYAEPDTIEQIVRLSETCAEKDSEDEQSKDIKSDDHEINDKTSSIDFFDINDLNEFANMTGSASNIALHGSIHNLLSEDDDNRPIVVDIESEMLTVANEPIEVNEVNVEAKPSFDNLETKPASDDIETKSVIDDFESKPEIVDVEAKILDHDVDTEPSGDAVETKLPVDDVDIKPSVDDVENKPSVDDIENKLSVDAVEINPSIDTIEAASSVDAVEPYACEACTSAGQTSAETNANAVKHDEEDESTIDQIDDDDVPPTTGDDNEQMIFEGIIREVFGIHGIEIDNEASTCGSLICNLQKALRKAARDDTDSIEPSTDELTTSDDPPSFDVDCLKSAASVDNMTKSNDDNNVSTDEQGATYKQGAADDQAADVEQTLKEIATTENEHEDSAKINFDEAKLADEPQAELTTDNDATYNDFNDDAACTSSTIFASWSYDSCFSSLTGDGEHITFDDTDDEDEIGKAAGDTIAPKNTDSDDDVMMADETDEPQVQEFASKMTMPSSTEFQSSIVVEINEDFKQDMAMGIETEQTTKLEKSEHELPITVEATSVEMKLPTGIEANIVEVKTLTGIKTEEKPIASLTPGFDVKESSDIEKLCNKVDQSAPGAIDVEQIVGKDNKQSASYAKPGEISPNDATVESLIKAICNNDHIAELD